LINLVHAQIDIFWKEEEEAKKREEEKWVG